MNVKKFLGFLCVVAMVAVSFSGFVSAKGIDDKEPIDESRDDFHNYAGVTSELNDMISQYPSLCTLYDIGSSVLGKTIWALKISDNPSLEEDEPEVRFAGAHHGDELMSVEMPLLLAWHLLDNYGSDSRITAMVDNTEIWIIPLVNPDGRDANTRYNANGVDLNRNYGYMWDYAGGSPFSEPETQAFRAHALENNIALSFSYHTSGDVVNYVWNYKGQPAADNEFILWWSEDYGSYNGYWVVEGYDWYQTRGDTNDFSYGCRGDFDTTIELQDYDIEDCWDKNHDGMLNTIEYADLGIRGIITDAETDDPIRATVWVEEAFWPHFTDPAVGDYHIPILQGTYNLLICANGYENKTATVTVPNGGNVVYSTSLEPAQNYYAQEVTIAVFDEYNDYANNPSEGPYALDAPDGRAASLGKGGYIVLDMGEIATITDLEDEDDFEVIELGDDDGYYVSVSMNWDGPWTSVGSGFGTSSFDLSSAGLSEARYVKITDDNDGSASETNPCVDIDAVKYLKNESEANTAPAIPSLSGPSSGIDGHPRLFEVSCFDNESDDLLYLFDWGDGTNSSWVGPFESDETGIGGHCWDAPGTYSVKVMAKDDRGMLGNWSDLFSVSISASASNYSLDFEAGWNFVSMPVDFTSTLMASEFSSAVLGCEMISWFDASSQSYSTYFAGGPASFDFEMEPGKAYFVLTQSPSSLRLGGDVIGSVGLPYYVGWNGFGWFDESSIMASVLANQFLGSEMISMFDESAQGYETYFVGGPSSFDFEIFKGMGFFVLTDSSGTWSS